MSCIDVPVPTLPSLPPGVSVSFAVPGFSTSVDLSFCCKAPPLPISIPPVPILSTVLNPALIATLNGYIAAVNAYLNSIPINCPWE